MRKSLFVRCLVIGLLTIILLIPLLMIEGVVSERKQRRDQVLSEIAQGWGGKQYIIGPILNIPHIEKSADGKTTTLVDNVYLPEKLNVEGNLKTEERYRGIYKAPVYTADLKVSGSFKLPETFSKDVSWKDATITLYLSDMRGIKRGVTFLLNGKESEIKTADKVSLTLIRTSDEELDILGSRSSYYSPQTQYINRFYVAPEAFKAVKDWNFDVSFALKGMESFAIVPVGRNTEIKLSSDWKHPSFSGNFSPTERQIEKNGFNALWQTSYLSSNLEIETKRWLNSTEFNFVRDNAVGFSLIDSLSVYQKIERSTKYAIMFILLVFAGFFLFEILKNLSIHWIQYGFVGLMLAMFYLLLLSFSEHIAFNLAYLLASAACVLSISFYLTSILSSKRLGTFFGVVVAAIYGSLFVLVNLEDYALIVGSLLLFVVLVFMMYITRKIDWNQV